MDGNQPIPQLGIPQRTVIKGDQTELAIAAASIIAKVWRDQLIVRLSQPNTLAMISPPIKAMAALSIVRRSKGWVPRVNIGSPLPPVGLVYSK